MDREIKFLLKGLCVLTKASASKESLFQGTSEHLIENVLHQNLTSLQSWLSDSDTLKQSDVLTYLNQALRRIGGNPEVTIRDVFSNTCIMMLDNLTNSINASLETKSNVKTTELLKNDNAELEDECPVLAVQQEKQISTSIQFVVVLGLCPFLPQGIGIPVSQRLGPGQILLASSYDTVTQLSEEDRIQRLSPILKLLIKMLNCKPLSDLIVEKYLSDVLVLLIQVRRSAKIVLQAIETNEPSVLKQDPEMSSASEKNVGQKLLFDSSEKLTATKLKRTLQECNIDLDRTIKTSNVSLVLKEILSLLGFAKSVEGTKAVPWFRRVLAGILRDIIMAPTGVQHLFSSFLGDLTSYDTKDWQKCKAVSRIISHCPVHTNNIQQFYSSISHQLIEMIHPREASVPIAVTKSVGATILELNSLQSDLMYNVCFAQILAPLIDCSINKAMVPSEKSDAIIVSEAKLTTCISHCHRLFVLSQETPSPICTKLKPVLGVLFAILVHIQKSVSHLKSLVKDLLIGFLNDADTKDGVDSLIELLLPSSQAGGCIPPIHPDLGLMSGLEGGVEVTVMREKQTSLESWTHPADTIVVILTCVKSDALNSDLFLALLQRLITVVSVEVNHSDDILLPSKFVAPEVKEATLTELREKVALVSLISAIGEQFGSTIIQSISQILVFTKVTLDRCVKMCASSDDPDTQVFEWETVTMALGLLSAVLTLEGMFSEEDKRVLDSILPLLSSLSQFDGVESHIQDMANDLKVAVATRGLVSVNLSGQHKSSAQEEKGKGQRTEQNPQEGSAKPLIEIISSTTHHKTEPNIGGSDQISSHDESKENSNNHKWSEALKEVTDPQIPVRGHGLIQLTRMLEDKEEGAKDQSDVLLKTFLDSLGHNDSYIYLASINGLAALSDLCPDDVIPSMASEFMKKCKDDQCPWQTTLKVGEAVVKATRRLGEMAPKYRDILMSTLLFGTRHENALVRASCLSGLAEVCRLLRFSVSPMIQEVLLCCRLILTSDLDPNPRRAAALTLTSLLQGLGKDTLTTFSDVLSELYRAVKTAVSCDLDEKVKVHAQLALQELDEIMKSFLFPAQDLKKSIKILGH